MNRKQPSCLAVTLACVLAAGAFAGAGVALKSRWRTDDMKVDGAIADWPSLTPVTAQVSAAAANDGDVLRLVVATSDPDVLQRLRLAGLDVYLDPADRKSEAFGIRVPPLGGRPIPGQPPADPYIAYVEVLGPAKDEFHIVNQPSETGIEAAAGNDRGTWVIELGVPMRTGEGRPYAPGIAPGTAVIGLGFVTPAPSAARGQSDRGGGARGGFGGGIGGFGGRSGGGGYGGRGGGPPGGGPPGDRDNPQGKAVKVWATIALATR